MDTSTDNVDKNKGGRPLKFKTVEELQAAIDAYFAMQDPHLEERLVESGINDKGETIFMKRKVMTEQKPYTVSGLARHLGITRQSLLNYQDRGEFFDTIEDAKERCHEFAESQLYFTKSFGGAAFSLKNNWGWKDKQEVDHTSDGKRIEAPAIYMSNIAPRDPDDAAAQAETS